MEISKQEDIEIENPILPFEPFIKLDINGNLTQDKDFLVNAYKQNKHIFSKTKIAPNKNTKIILKTKGRKPSAVYYKPINTEEKQTLSNNDIESTKPNEGLGNPFSTYNPFLEEEKALEDRHTTNSKEAVFFSSALPPSLSPFEESTPSTQRTIPPPTIKPEQPTYIITTTTENPSPTRRVQSIRRFLLLYLVKAEITYLASLTQIYFLFTLMHNYLLQTHSSTTKATEAEAWIKRRLL